MDEASERVGYSSIYQLFQHQHPIRRGRNKSLLAGRRFRLYIKRVSRQMEMNQSLFLAGRDRPGPRADAGRNHAAASPGSARIAVQLPQTIRPDVMLMDISMPGMDGIKAT